MLCCPDTEALTFLSALFWYALHCRENTALGQENQSQICINYVMPGLGLIPSVIVCEHTDTLCLPLICTGWQTDMHAESRSSYMVSLCLSVCMFTDKCLFCVCVVYMFVRTVWCHWSSTAKCWQSCSCLQIVSEQKSNCRWLCMAFKF